LKLKDDKLNDYFDCNKSIYPLTSVLNDFKKIETSDNTLLFKLSMSGFDFYMSGVSEAGGFKPSSKYFKNKEDFLHSYLKNKTKVYAEAYYNSLGHLSLITNYYNGLLDSSKTHEAAYQVYLNGEVSVSSWYFEGVLKTHLVRNFCEKNEIDMDNIKDDELELILINLKSM